jgi:molecular chaperone GrpE
MTERTEDEATHHVKVNDRRRVHVTDADQPVVEAAAAAPAPTIDPSEVARLTQELEAARKRVDELARAYQAGERDREEFKIRLTRERERLLDVERGTIAVALLEAIDELDLCLVGVAESPLSTGVRMIRDNLLRRAAAQGIEPVALEGKPFDPNQAEASDMEITTEAAEDGKVISVLRGCYQLKGKVIRPGRVKVAKYFAPAQA